MYCTSLHPMRWSAIYVCPHPEADAVAAQKRLLAKMVSREKAALESQSRSVAAATAAADAVAAAAAAAADTSAVNAAADAAAVAAAGAAAAAAAGVAAAAVEHARIVAANAAGDALAAAVAVAAAAAATATAATAAAAAAADVPPATEMTEEVTEFTLACRVIQGDNTRQGLHSSTFRFSVTHCLSEMLDGGSLSSETALVGCRERGERRIRVYTEEPGVHPAPRDQTA